MKTVWIFFIIISFQLTITIKVRGQGNITGELDSSCTTSNNEFGNCISIQNCTSIRNEQLSRPFDRNYRQYIQQSNEICKLIIQDSRLNVGLVCCPNLDLRSETQAITPSPIPRTPPTKITPAPITSRPIQSGTSRYTLLTPETGCGFSNVTYNKIMGGYPAELGAYPWMAVLRYYSFETNRLEFLCGGSLITKRHVLTAAHCINRYTRPDGAQLLTARLGEHNYTTDLETEHIDFEIEMEIEHEEYNHGAHNNDIAILVLATEVQFTDLIRPICIPFEEPYRSLDFEGYNPIVAGWGRLRHGGVLSEILREVQVEVLNLQECNDRYNSITGNNYEFTSSMLCAGYMKGKMDSCQGDSGGPLMMPNTINDSMYFYAIGLVSFGRGCGGVGLPGIYVRVQLFVKWISDKIGLL